MLEILGRGQSATRANPLWPVLYHVLEWFIIHFYSNHLEIKTTEVVFFGSWNLKQFFGLVLGSAGLARGQLGDVMTGQNFGQRQVYPAQENVKM